MTSPGEQSQAPPNARRIAFLLLLVALVAGYVFVYREHIEEYRLYFSSERQPVTFKYTDLSETWTEKTLHDRFRGFKVRCFHETGNPLGERVCGLDAKSHNGVPVLFLTFFFSAGQLSHVSINIPWWAHGEGRTAIESALGPPAARQLLPRSGVRLLGWQLPGGAALFYNRDRDMNPLIWNAIYWNSARSCKLRGCFTP